MRSHEVDPLEWDLVAMSDRARARRLLNSPRPSDLIAQIATAAEKTAQTGTIELRWQSSVERPGFARIVAVVQVSADLFDPLFNGRTGYRAHYYLCEQAGADFNRALISALTPALKRNHAVNAFAVPWALIDDSLAGPWSKIWVAGDGGPFRASAPGELRPARWARDPKIDVAEALALRAPLPPKPAIDVKGSWFRSTDGETWVSEEKRDRDKTLHERGIV